MKYDWKFFTQFAWTKLDVKPKKKKPKIVLTPRRQRLQSIAPVFTFHSLQRLSERVCHRYKKPSRVIIGNYIVPCLLEWWWIPPRLIQDCIEDIQHSMFTDVMYSEERNTFAIHGERAIYIMSKEHAIVTLYKEFEKEEKKKYRKASQRDTLAYFNL